MTKKEALVRLSITYALLDNIKEQTGKYVKITETIRTISVSESEHIEDSLVKAVYKFEAALNTKRIASFSDIPPAAVLAIIIDNLIAVSIAWSNLDVTKYQAYADQLIAISNTLLNYWKYKFDDSKDEGFILMDNIIKELCK